MKRAGRHSRAARRLSFASPWARWCCIGAPAVLSVGTVVLFNKLTSREKARDMDGPRASDSVSHGPNRTPPTTLVAVLTEHVGALPLDKRDEGHEKGERRRDVKEVVLRARGKGGLPQQQRRT